MYLFTAPPDQNLKFNSNLYLRFFMSRLSFWSCWLSIFTQNANSTLWKSYTFISYTLPTDAPTNHNSCVEYHARHPRQRQQQWLTSSPSLSFSTKHQFQLLYEEVRVFLCVHVCNDHWIAWLTAAMWHELWWSGSLAGFNLSSCKSLQQKPQQHDHMWSYEGDKDATRKKVPTVSFLVRI